MRIIRAVPERGTVNLPFLVSSATMLLPSSITAHVQGNIILYIYTRNFQWYSTGRITGSQVTREGRSSGLVFVHFKIVLNSSLVNGVEYIITGKVLLFSGLTQLDRISWGPVNLYTGFR